MIKFSVLTGLNFSGEPPEKRICISFYSNFRIKNGKMKFNVIIQIVLAMKNQSFGKFFYFLFVSNITLKLWSIHVNPKKY